MKTELTSSEPQLSVSELANSTVWARLPLFSRNMLFSSLQFSTLGFFIFNAVIKSLLPLPRRGYYKTAPRVSDYKVALSFFYSFFLYWNSSEISNILFNTKVALTETPLALHSVILAICSLPPQLYCRLVQE